MKQPALIPAEDMTEQVLWCWELTLKSVLSAEKLEMRKIRDMVKKKVKHLSSILGLMENVGSKIILA